MRVIEFRAWDKIKKEMFDPVGVMDLNQDGVMQYTGLKDKNGKEIYEGDIVQAKGMRGGANGVVEYDSDRAKFVLNISDVAGSVDKFDDSDLDWESYEILGNIYENPELLKK